MNVNQNDKWPDGSPLDVDFMRDMIVVLQSAIREYETALAQEKVPSGILTSLLRTYSKSIYEYGWESCELERAERVRYKIAIALEEIYREAKLMALDFNQTNQRIVEKVAPLLRKLIGSSEAAEIEIAAKLNDITLSAEETEDYGSQGPAELSKKLAAELLGKSASYFRDLRRREEVRRNSRFTGNRDLAKDYLEKSLHYPSDIVDQLINVLPPDKTMNRSEWEKAEDEVQIEDHQ